MRGSRPCDRAGFRFHAAWLLACLFVAPALAAEPDFDREERLRNEIVDAIIDGEPIELEANGRGFLGIYTEADDPVGGVLILHGRGFHPNWADTVYPLRTGLVEQGWNTLAIQMPVLEKDAKYNDYVPIFADAHERIEAGLHHLREQSKGKIVLIAHSCGAHMAHHWIHAKGEAATAQFDAYVGLGMGATDYKQPMVEPFPLDRIKSPVLDLYGSNEYPAVIRLAPQRLELIEKAGNPKSRQQVLEGADHYFRDKGDALVAAVGEWLAEL